MPDAITEPLASEPAPAEPVEVIPEHVPESVPEPVPEDVPEIPTHREMMPPETVVEAVPEAGTAQAGSTTAQITLSEPLATTTEPLPTPQAKPAVSTANPITNLVSGIIVKARAVLQINKRKKLDKIMVDVAKRGSITNDQVEKLLHVSDATSTRYLSQLVKEGKLKQVGKVGPGVRYVKI